MQAGANNITTMLLGRIIAGVAIGCLSMTVPLYNVSLLISSTERFVTGWVYSTDGNCAAED